MKRQALILFLLIGASLTAWPGCGSLDPETGRMSLGYVPARFYDLMDVVELNLGVDSQVSFFATAAVEPIALGGGFFEGEKLGIDGRLLGQWSEKRLEINAGPEAFIRYEKVPNAGNRYLKNAYYCPHRNQLTSDGVFYEEWGLSPRFRDHERRFLDIVAEVHILSVGLDVSLSPLELIDFITGIFFIDVVSDDDWVTPMPERQWPFEDDTTEDDALIAVDQ